MKRKSSTIRLQPAVLLLLLLLLATGFHGALADCEVPTNGGLPDPEPLILLPGGSQDVFGFKLPSRRRSLVFAEGERVRLVCPGPGNSLWALSPLDDVTVTCVGGSFLSGGVGGLPLAAFNCSGVSASTTRVTPSLCNGDRNQVVQIGFEVGCTEFYPTMDVCFDDVSLETVWSAFWLVSSIRDGEVGLLRPLFAAGPHYPGVNPEALYSRAVQRNTLAATVGPEHALRFVPRSPPDSRSYISRGHLTASADFPYNALKLSTYYFINAAPQWYPFNDGSWRQLESDVRFYAHSRRRDLRVFTGTWGVTTLPDAAGREHPLFLDVPAERIAVPAVFWKVLYDPVDSRGIAFVGVNNPHKTLSEVDSDGRYQLCEAKVDVMFWGMCRAYQPEYQEQGFGYCCEIDDFRRSVTSLPSFPVTGVLE